MIIQWRCTCGEINETDMDKWKKVKDGQGFKEDCPSCEKKIDIDIEVKTYSY